MIFYALRFLLLVIAFGCAAAISPRTSTAQSSSLYQQDIPMAQGQELTLANTSWLYQKVEPPKEIKLHDIVTIVVSEKNQLISEGQVQRRRKAQYDAQLQNWIAFKGLNLVASNPSEGEPRATGNLNVQNQAQMELETRDALLFRIAATVVDIRPNGTFVIEARRTVRDNDELWERSLTGIIRREDVLPNNTVLSENVAELSIFKRELGHVRDGYKRGWFSYWFDRFSPF
jgi:flagellar L-ring protein precursor FlgH